MTDNDRQFIADLYHCSDVWGEKTTVADMAYNLEQWKEELPDEYIPDKSIAKECTEYWNELCELYPN